jgi:hypothetical protein
LSSLAVDQAADGLTDIKAILMPKWNEMRVNYSLWHKVCYPLCIRSIVFIWQTYPIAKSWKSFVSARTKKRGPLKYPKLHVLFDSNTFSASKWKNHFIYCSVCFLLSFRL